MERGDISNEIPPRVIVVFDGLLGQIPDTMIKRVQLLRSVGRWRSVADAYDINPMARAQMHDLTWRHNVRVDVVTFDHDKVAERLAERFNRMNLSVSNTFSVADPAALVLALPYMPEVRYVVHGMREMGMAFGPRGRFGFNEVLV